MRLYLLMARQYLVSVERVGKWFGWLAGWRRDSSPVWRCRCGLCQAAGRRRATATEAAFALPLVALHLSPRYTIFLFSLFFLFFFLVVQCLDGKGRPGGGDLGPKGSHRSTEQRVVLLTWSGRDAKSLLLFHSGKSHLLFHSGFSCQQFPVRWGL